MPNPYKEIASMFKNQITKNIDKKISGIPCELGTITENGNLKLDNFKFEISDYLVSFWYEKLALKPGERVLVVPVNSGQDYVVIAKISGQRVSTDSGLICVLSQMWHEEEQKRIDGVATLSSENKSKYNAAVLLINELKSKVKELAQLTNEIKQKYNDAVILINKVKELHPNETGDIAPAQQVMSNDVSQPANADASTVTASDTLVGGW
ncbi:hypothetical protein Q2T46_11775 [Thermoanaerobacterium sp. CMT5567-10]|uniref:hypothetical protein n=1 Tax=Thermoanaerobacterium sp. CMT5567-10 TaxID=3061989 RepID=UPI0026DFD284|nr:hypothetical protein [Thermoanaerobacterium sp. CMT5567-10]WKV08206.1 hypothetical protein Q2T46_11775 [Thermoanaerobacterium sp. CMT5567-10]